MSRGDAAFLELENQIWRTVFEIALGKPTRMALEELLNNMETMTLQPGLVIPLTTADSLSLNGQLMETGRRLSRMKFSWPDAPVNIGILNFPETPNIQSENPSSKHRISKKRKAGGLARNTARKRANISSSMPSSKWSETAPLWPYPFQ